MSHSPRSLQLRRPRPIHKIEGGAVRRGGRGIGRLLLLVLHAEFGLRKWLEAEVEEEKKEICQRELPLTLKHAKGDCSDDIGRHHHAPHETEVQICHVAGHVLQMHVQM